ncbi:hypothetical protein HDV01_000037 [Terramyces sp. JEL0728]|nr:hypothetical protein HDV01_000037 [Terramyces sp. JEL0728]
MQMNEDFGWQFSNSNPFLFQEPIKAEPQPHMYEYAEYPLSLSFDPSYIPEQPVKPIEQKEKEVDQFICSEDGCGKGFKKKSAFQSHMKSHTDSPKPFVCNICSWSFSRSHDLKRHEFIHSKDKPFTCPGCNRGFSRRDALKRHLDTWKGRRGNCGQAAKKDKEYSLD